MLTHSKKDPNDEIHVEVGPPAMALEELVRRIGKYLADTHVERAILFGSYARGSADSTSDLDLILIERTSLPFLERGRSHLPLFRLGPGVDLLVYTPEEFEELAHRGNALVECVLVEGITIYERSAS
jgi:predicted nucleotidyltransferase